MRENEGGANNIGGKYVHPNTSVPDHTSVLGKS